MKFYIWTFYKLFKRWKKKRKTEFFHRAKKSVSIFSSCSKNHFYLYSYENQRNYSDTKRERERDEIKENNKLSKKIVENDGKL